MLGSKCIKLGLLGMALDNGGRPGIVTDIGVGSEADSGATGANTGARAGMTTGGGM